MSGKGMAIDVGGWLRGLGLGQYEATFRENEIDETVLASLTHETLKEIGVTPVGHRLKLLDAIAALRTCKRPVVRSMSSQRSGMCLALAQQTLPVRSSWRGCVGGAAADRKPPWPTRQGQYRPTWTRPSGPAHHEP